MGSLTLAAVAINADWQRRVGYYMSLRAIIVMEEEDTTNNYLNRIAYANAVLKGEASVYQMALAVLTNPTIAENADDPEDLSGTDVPDTDIDFVVGDIWDSMSGVI
jgi:hypothetical protein